MNEEIINGKLYNIATATPLAAYNNGLPFNDFRFLEETLYRKRNGEYFLHGRGGAMTRYASFTGDHRSGTSKITPLSPEEAQKWCEQHCDAQTYISIWGIPVE